MRSNYVIKLGQEKCLNLQIKIKIKKIKICCTDENSGIVNEENE